MKLFLGVFLLSIFLTACISFRSVITGSTPFWFDPARDFLLASQNQKKLTLIGPPTGIPGVFYGPYWIWAISLAMFISLDPRIITLLILTIPYFIFFPLILFRLSRWMGIGISFLIWIFFILSYERYTTFLWNPHLSSLFFLFLTLCVVTKDSSTYNKQIIRSSLVGILCGLILTIHMSFGFGVFLSTFFFLIIENLTDVLKANQKNRGSIFLRKIILMVLFGIGAGIALVPFALFEARHGFNQIHAFIQTITQATLYNSASVGQLGLTKAQIIDSFFSIPASFFHISRIHAMMVLGLCFLSFFYHWIKRDTISPVIQRGAGYLLLTVVAILTLYLTSKNPVWEYHFVSVEIIVLLLLGFLIVPSKLLFRVGCLWAIVVIGLFVISYSKTFSVDPLSVSSLGTKQHIVENVIHDAGGPFRVYAYSSAIYTYDYDYLFQWLGNKNYNPSIDTLYTYLIIPKTSQAIYDDFIHYKTPDERFKTVKTWNFADGTDVVKREEKKNAAPNSL